ncbi:MAG: hypothetical protein R3F30_03830 [Planctomycetota bacterium]
MSGGVPPAAPTTRAGSPRGRAGRYGALVLVAMLPMLLASYRHYLFWGEAVADWVPGALNAGELGAVLLFTAASCLLLRRGLGAVAAGSLDEAGAWRVGLGLCALGLLCLPILSEDLFSYVGRGRLLALHGGNPWVDLASRTMPGDPALPLMKGWADFPLPYGPLLALGNAALAAVGDLWPSGAGGRVWAGLFLVKLTTVLGLLLAARALCALVPRADGARRTRLLVLFLWNPFVVLEFAVDGHNDVFLVLPLLWGLGLAGRAGLGLVLATLAKPTALAAGPVLLATEARRGALGRFAVAAAAGAALLAGAWALWWSGPGGLDWIARQRGIGGASLQALCLGVLPLSREAVQLGGAAVVAVLCLLLALRLRGDPWPALVATFLATHLVGLPVAHP